MNLNKQTVTHWGKDYIITPVLLDKVFGDGKQTIELSPMNTRPDYYVARIDSSVDISDNDDTINYLELEDGVIDNIQSVYGVGSGDGDPFPALDLDCGYGWCLSEEVNNE